MVLGLALFFAMIPRNQMRDPRSDYVAEVLKAKTADPNIKATVDNQKDITIIKLGVTPGFDFGAYLERSAQSSSLPQTDPVLNNIRLDLHVVTTPELQMQTAMAKLSGREMSGQADTRGARSGGAMRGEEFSRWP